MKHTPIHTEANKEDAGRVFFRTYIKDAHNNLIAECHDEDEAEHIVKCVNSHDGLILALIDIENESRSGNDYGESLAMIRKYAKQALKAAGETV